MSVRTKQMHEVADISGSIYDIAKDAGQPDHAGDLKKATIEVRRLFKRLQSVMSRMRGSEPGM